MDVLRPGFVADMVILDDNPLEDFKVLIGRGPVDKATGQPQRRSRIRAVIVDGRIRNYDHPLLRRFAHDGRRLPVNTATTKGLLAKSISTQ